MNIYTVKVKQGELVFQTDLPALSPWEAMRLVMEELHLTSAVGLLVSVIKTGRVVK